MNLVQEVNDFIHSKIERQAILKARKQELEDISQNINISKFKRFFGTSYLILKRYTTLILGILLVCISIFLIVKPSFLLQDKEVKELVVTPVKVHYYLTAEEALNSSIEEAIIQLVSNGTNANAERVIKAMDNSIEQSSLKNVEKGIQILFFILLMIGIFILYVSRKTKKIRRKNSEIGSIETITKSIIEDYNRTIEEEEKELELLKEISSRLSSNQTTII